MLHLSGITRVGVMLAVPTVLWLAGQVFGYGPGFSAPGVPTHVLGPAAKGTLTLTLLGTTTTARFQGRCSNNPVDGTIDVSNIVEPAAFLAATDKQIADGIEGWVLTNFAYPGLVPAFTSCYKSFSGLYLGAVNKSLSKTAIPNGSVWVGEVTIHGYL